jgi:hypothetical protein
MEREHTQNTSGEGDAPQTPDLTARLISRLTTPGLVDVRQPRRQYERTALWAVGRHALLERLQSRRTPDGDSTAAGDSRAPGQMLFRSVARGGGAAATDAAAIDAASTFARAHAAAHDTGERPAGALSAETPPAGKLRVRRKPTPKAPGGGQTPEVVTHAPAAPVARHARGGGPAPAATAHEPPSTPGEGRASARANDVALPVRPRATASALILPKRHGSHAGAEGQSRTAAIFSAPPRIEAASAARYSTDRAAMQRVSRDGQARVASAAGAAAGDADTRPPAAFELRAQSSLAPPPGVVWHKGAHRPAGGGAGADGRGDAQVIGRQMGADATAHERAVPTAADIAEAEARLRLAESLRQQKEAQTTAADPGRIAEQVMRDISRRLVVERERRGLRN